MNQIPDAAPVAGWLANEKKPLSQINSALDSLNATRNSLANELCALADQLKRVLRPSSPPAPECPTPPLTLPPSSDLALTIDAEVRALRELAEQVRDLAARLDL